MKHLILTALLFWCIQLSGQRDTFDYQFYTDTDSIFYEIDGSDTTATYQYFVNGYERVAKYGITFSFLDSLLLKQAGDINNLAAQVEAIYREYQRQNTILWNLKKEFARWEELTDELYTP